MNCNISCLCSHLSVSHPGWVLHQRTVYIIISITMDVPHFNIISSTSLSFVLTNNIQIRHEAPPSGTLIHPINAAARRSHASFRGFSWPQWLLMVSRNEPLADVFLRRSVMSAGWIRFIENNLFYDWARFCCFLYMYWNYFIFELKT